MDGLQRVIHRVFYDIGYRLGFLQWDIHAAQPALVDLVRDGMLSGRTVLDIGCGVGENAAFLADAGFEVLGIDYSGIAIARARSRAAQTGGPEYKRHDVFELRTLGGAFDVAIDFATYHILPESRLPDYADNLASVTREGSIFVLLCFNQNAPEERLGPRRVSQQEIRRVFSDRWEITRIDDSIYRSKSGDMPCWLSLMSRV